MRFTTTLVARAAALCILAAAGATYAQHAHQAQASTPAATATATATVAAASPTEHKFVLHTNIVDGKMVYVNDKGQVNPTLQARVGDTVEVVLDSGEGAEHDFVISELKTGFSIGFLIYIPFLVLDMVISSVLLAMGMMMLPPMMVSMPFKLLLFVMVDGWNLLVGSLVNSFLL